MNRRQSALTESVIAFVALTFAMFLLLMLSSGLSGTGMAAVLSPIDWLTRLDPGAAFDTLSNAAEVIAGVLGIAITVVAIVLELAANRYSHRITWLFLRDPVNIVVLSLFVLTTLQCVWIAAAIGGPDSPSNHEAIIPGAGFAITLGLVTISLLALLPYFNFVFAFLSPLSMIEKIRNGALTRIRKLRLSNLERTQNAVEQAVDELQEVARTASEHSDRSIAMATVDALAELLASYGELRKDLPPDWFKIAPAIAADPDFVSLSASALEDIEESKVWLEVKIMEQYLSLMALCVPKERDIANLIAIKTCQIATDTGRDRDELRALCMRCMNSYLRTTINASDPRTTYYILNQYRLFAEQMLRSHHHDDVIRIARYLKFYGNLGYEAGMPFLLETAAHDLVELIEVDLAEGEGLTDELLTLLLDLDREIKHESQEQTLLGIRRSQMQLGTFLLERGDVDRAGRVAIDLASEPPQRIERVLELLDQAHEPQYWEFTARGVNFAYLPPECRRHLPRLAEMVAAANRHDETSGRNSEVSSS
ncbi:MAG: DUF2254 domain-containing protein [Deltaproteobacteria bacterium]|nr:DUF2254 domain-containing protein [Deltaproteobacteria bacterium]